MLRPNPEQQAGKAVSIPNSSGAPIDFWRSLKFTSAMLAASVSPFFDKLAQGSEATSGVIPIATATLEPKSETEIDLQDQKLPPAPNFIGPHFHSASQLQEEAERLVQEHPNLAAIERIGESVSGRPLWYLRLARNVTIRSGNPKVLFIAGVHGDERVQPELMLALSRFLLNNYSVDQRVRDIIDNTTISIVFCANPDGWELGTRNNANDVDLNRDFPSIHSGRRISARSREPETKALMGLVSDEHFNLVIDFHGTVGGRGSVFVNTPYDNQSTDNPGDRFGDYQLAVTIAHAYADANPHMRERNNSYLCGGVTIGGGSAWFQAPTGPDCHAAHFDTTALTVEVSNPKKASLEEMRDYFSANLSSMIVSLEAAQHGYHLEVVTEDGKPIPNATVSISSSTRNITYDDHRIHRLAPRGKHEIIVSHWGYEPAALWAESTRFDGAYTRIVLKRNAAE